MTLRVAIVVTHLLGAGHLMRAAAIGRALAEAGHGVTLVSGGRPTPLVDTAGLNLVQLPAVRAEIGDLGTLRDGAGRPAGPELLRDRIRLLLAAVAAARPDVLVTELFPFGRRALAAEYDALLADAEASERHPVIVSSVRDVLVAPDKPGKVVDAHRRTARHYDAVLVHGDETFIPLDASWPVDDALRERLVYTGYVGPDDGLWAADRQSRGSLGQPRRPVRSRGDRSCKGEDGSVLVSGGSSAASLPLYRAALAAAGVSRRPWRVLVGHGVGEDDFTTLTRGRPPNASVERARPDFRDLLARASIFVGQAGYNTVMDIVATKARSVLVPFEAGRETEQRLRAEALAARGVAAVVAESALSPDTLTAAVEQVSSRPRPDLSLLSLDGANRTARLLEALAASPERVGRRVSRP